MLPAVVTSATLSSEMLPTAVENYSLLMGTSEHFGPHLVQHQSGNSRYELSEDVNDPARQLPLSDVSSLRADAIFSLLGAVHLSTSPETSSSIVEAVPNGNHNTAFFQAAIGSSTCHADQIFGVIESAAQPTNMLLLQNQSMNDNNYAQGFALEPRHSHADSAARLEEPQQMFVADAAGPRSEAFCAVTGHGVAENVQDETQTFAAALDEALSPLSPSSILSGATIATGFVDETVCHPHVFPFEFASNRISAGNATYPQYFQQSSTTQPEVNYSGDPAEQSSVTHGAGRMLGSRLSHFPLNYLSSESIATATSSAHPLESLSDSCGPSNASRMVTDPEGMSTASASSVTNSSPQRLKIHDTSIATTVSPSFSHFVTSSVPSCNPPVAPFSKQGIVASVQTLGHLPSKSGRGKFPKILRPSRFCHVCGRKGGDGAGKLAICGRIQKAECRKVVCEICLGKHGWNVSALRTNCAEKAISDIDGSWQCPHCDNACGEYAQCATYRRTNHKRHLMLREKKKSSLKHGITKLSGS